MMVASVSKRLKNRVRNICHAVATDAAADELLASEIMRSAELSGMGSLTPNLQTVLRDCAHACKRLVARPWGADEKLKEVVFKVARGRGSISQMIQHSGEFQDIFKKYQGTSMQRSVSSMVSNLRSCPQRFDSIAKPMGRCCLFFHALWKTTTHIANLRQDKSQKVSADFLEWISSDEENAVLMGLMADAADELLCLIRILDDENIPASELNIEVHRWLSTVENLFKDKAVLKTHGYTRIMLETLSKPLVAVVGDRVFTVGREGGISDAVVDRALERMVNWVDLARSCAQSEFPDFELAYSMQVLSLPKSKKRHYTLDEDEQVACYERLGKVFRVDPVALRKQAENIVPRTTLLAREEKLTSDEAWKKMMAKLESSHSSQPFRELQKVLRRAIALGISTSGVEQNFGKASWVFSNRQFHATPALEEAFFKCAVDLPVGGDVNDNDEVDDIIRNAQSVWVECMGVARTATKTFRVHRGAPQKRSLAECAPLSQVGESKKRRVTETEFVAARRTESRNMLSQASSASRSSLLELPTARKELSATWTEGHAKEATFQQMKLQKRRVPSWVSNVD